MKQKSGVLFFILLAFKIALPSHAKLPFYPNELRPFSTDGCSMVPDMTFLDCCKLHDLAYWKGGTEEERLTADIKLGKCVEIVGGKTAGFVFYTGVRRGGRPGTGKSYRWGYGWKYEKGYGALSREELRMVKKLAPRDVLSVPVTNTDTSPKNYPSKNADYCVDEIEEYLNVKYRTEGSQEKIEINDYQVNPSYSIFPRKYVVHIPECRDPLVFDFGKSSEKICKKMRAINHTFSFLTAIKNEETCSF